MLSKLNKMLTENGLFAIGSVGTEFPAVGRELFRIANAITLSIENLYKEQQDKFLKGELKAYRVLTALYPYSEEEFDIEIKDLTADTELHQLTKWLAFQMGIEESCSTFFKEPTYPDSYSYAEELKTSAKDAGIHHAIHFATATYTLNSQGLSVSIESLFDEVEVERNLIYVNREFLFEKLKGLSKVGFNVEFKAWRQTTDLHQAITAMLCELPKSLKGYVDLDAFTLQHRGNVFGHVNVGVSLDSKIISIRYRSNFSTESRICGDYEETLLRKLTTLNYDAVLEHFTKQIEALHTK